MPRLASLRRRPSCLPRLLRCLLVGLAPLLAACPSLSSLHTARPIEPGATEFAFGVGTYGYVDANDEDVYLPLLETQVRHGLTERLDAGLQVNGFSMVQVDLNYALVLEPGFALSVDPTFAVLPVGGVLATYAWLPLLADVYTGEDLTVTLSARWGYVALDDLDDGDDGDLGLDGSTELAAFGVGAHWRLGNGVVLVPELHLAVPLDEDLERDRLVSFSLGFKF